MGTKWVGIVQGDKQCYHSALVLESAKCKTGGISIVYCQAPLGYRRLILPTSRLVTSCRITDAERSKGGVT